MAETKKKPTRKKFGGRQKGTPNKSTAAFKQAVLAAFEGIGGLDRFTRWANRHPTEFYTRIAVRLIPHEVGISAKVRIEDKRAVLRQIPDAVLNEIVDGEASANKVH